MSSAIVATGRGSVSHPTATWCFLQGDFRYQNFWLANLHTGETRQLTKLKTGYSVRSFDISARR